MAGLGEGRIDSASANLIFHRDKTAKKADKTTRGVLLLLVIDYCFFVVNRDIRRGATELSEIVGNREKRRGK
jgi:hypothetical protein